MLKKISVYMLKKILAFIEDLEILFTSSKYKYSTKIIDSYNLEKSIEIKTESGVETVKQIHKTRPYFVYRITTESGKTLDCADLHILIKGFATCVFAKDLKIGDYIQTIDGKEKVIDVEFLGKQSFMYDLTLNGPLYTYYTNGILSHNTITASIFNAWYTLFNTDKNTMIAANKLDTAKEIIDKTKVIFENLPFFMKPGIYVWNAFSVSFDNGCKINSTSTSSRAGIGFTIHNLYLDEFAHIEDSVVNEFFENLFPTISSSKISKTTITSTQNGFNKFYELYSGAERGENEFVPLKVNWYDVPGRDQKWYEQQVGILGSEEAFARQYGTEFVASNGLLLSSMSLQKLRLSQINYNKLEYIDAFEDIGILKDDFNITEYFRIHPDYKLEYFSDPSRFYVFSIDISEGIGSDYSVINVFEIVKYDLSKPAAKYINSIEGCFRLKQCAIFRCNLLSLSEFSEVAYRMATRMFYQENLHLNVEYNTYGSEFMYRLETIDGDRNDFDNNTLVKYDIGNGKKRAGLKITSNKPTICLNFKHLYEKDYVEISEFNSINELATFGKNKSGKFVGLSKNDDIAMSCIEAGYYMNSKAFKYIIDDIFDSLNEDSKNEILNHIGTQSEESEYSDNIYDIF